MEKLHETLNMFMYLAVELTLLFLSISFLVGVLQAYIHPNKIKRILSSKNGTGYVVAGFLGAITPFCSCSTIPFLKGLIRARADFGTMMVFLFASPLLNPMTIGILAFTFGWKVTFMYFSIAMGVAVMAGFLLEKFRFSKYIKPEIYNVASETCCSSSCPNEPNKVNKWFKIWQSTWEDFKKVLPYLMISILLGSIIYGFMPGDFIASVANESNPFAVPIAAIIGIPLYIRSEIIIPLSAALVSKGMSLGAVMALIIGSAGASLTEVILLKSIFKNQMIVAFVLVVLTMAICAGYIYNTLF